MSSPVASTSPAATPLWRRVLRGAWLVAVVVAVALVARDRGAEVSGALSRLPLSALLWSLLLIVAAVGVTGAVWRRLLTGFGATLPWTGVARMFFVGQLGKYLPGSLWPVVAQMEIGRDYAVPARASAGAFAVFMAVYALWGTVAGAVALPAAGLAAWPWALLAAPALVLSAPAVMRAVLRRLLRLVRRTPLERFPGLAAVRDAAGLTVLSWCLAGLHLWVLARGLDVELSWAGAVGVYAASWVAGFAVLVAPAGAGAREAAMVLLLAPVTDPGTALVIALLSRLLGTVADALWGALGLAVPTRGVLF